MASSSSPSLSSFNHIITTKLTNEISLMWKLQNFAYLRRQDLYSYVNGTTTPPSEFLFESSSSPSKPNPNFLSWQCTNRLVLSVFFLSISDLLLGHVLSFQNVRALWVSLASTFASHSKAKEFQLHFLLTNLSKGNQSITNYFGKVCSLVDSLAATGNSLSVEEVALTSLMD